MFVAYLLCFPVPRLPPPPRPPWGLDGFAFRLVSLGSLEADKLYYVYVVSDKRGWWFRSEAMERIALGARDGTLRNKLKFNSLMNDAGPSSLVPSLCSHVRDTRKLIRYSSWIKRNL